MTQCAIFYTVCCNVMCSESGGIKKNAHKCCECKKFTTPLSLELLNEKYCTNGNMCYDKQCHRIHPNKNHQSPPFISPCIQGKSCNDESCVFLHPDPKCGSWLVRISLN